MENELFQEKVTHTMDLIQCDIKSIRVELEHNRELFENRLDGMERQCADHETRLRDATAGVTQFRLWSSLSSGGSSALSLIALIKSFWA